MAKNAEVQVEKPKIIANKAIAKALFSGVSAVVGNEIAKRTLVLAPVKDGNLRQSIKVVLYPEVAEVSVNVPYAKIRHEVNNKNPSTRKYLYNATKSINVKNIRIKELE